MVYGENWFLCYFDETGSVRDFSSVKNVHLLKDGTERESATCKAESPVPKGTRRVEICRWRPQLLLPLGVSDEL